jgi:hypothetical protein
MALNPQLETDPVLKLMKSNSIPVTRENYLEVAYLGEAPDPLPAKLEAELPESLQNK